MAETVKNFGETLTQLIDKLAGKGSDVKLSFQNLELEIGVVKATLNGSVILDVQYVSEKK